MNLKNRYWILSDGQKKLKMYENILSKTFELVEVIRETTLFYFMKNGDKVYKSSGHQKVYKYPHIYFDGEEKWIVKKLLNN